MVNAEAEISALILIDSLVRERGGEAGATVKVDRRQRCV